MNNNNILTILLAIGLTVFICLYFFEKKDGKSESQFLIEQHEEEIKKAQERIAILEYAQELEQFKRDSIEAVNIRTAIEKDSLIKVIKNKDFIIKDQQKKIIEINNKFKQMDETELHEWLQKFFKEKGIK